MMVGVGFSTRSPRWGERWGEGARPRRITADAAHPHPALSLQGEGCPLLGPIAGDEELLADLFEDGLGAPEHIVVPEPQDAVAVTLDDFCSGGVPLGVVLTTVQFDREARGAAGEVGDVAVDLELTNELLAFEAARAEMVPEAFLGFRLVAAEPSRDRSKAPDSHRRTPSPNPLPHGERAMQASLP